LLSLMERLVMAVMSSKRSIGSDPSSSFSSKFSNTTLPFSSQATSSKLGSQQPQSQTDFGLNQALPNVHPSAPLVVLK